MYIYIDPGTGSMLFAVVMGVVATLVFVFQGLIIKLKSYIGVSKKDLVVKDKLQYVIYSDHKRYDSIFKPILDEFEKRKIEVSFWTQSPDDPLLNEKYKYVKSEFIGEGNKGFAKLNMINAHILLSTTPGLDVYQWKRSKNCDKYVHIEHGLGNCVGYRLFGLDFYDSVFVANDLSKECIQELESKRNIKKKDIEVVGIPNLDTDLDKVKNIKQEEREKKNILVAPSWGKFCMLYKFGTALIDKLLETNYHIILRPHPQSFTSDKEVLDKIISKYKDKIEINNDNNNFDVLSRADVLISDFSSVMVEFAFLFERPYIYCISEEGMDRSIYDAFCLENPEKRDKFRLEAGTELKEDNINELPNLITDMINNKEKYKSRIIETRNKAWANVGNSSKIVVDKLVEM